MKWFDNLQTKFANFIYSKKTKVNQAQSFQGPFDINQFLGTWKQMYRTPNSFQSDQAISTFADYSLLDNGNIQVTNIEYLPNNEKTTVTGEAYFSNESATQLWVSFFPLILSPYWILDIHQNDQNQYDYIMVGSPFSNSLWVLKKNTEIELTPIEKLKEQQIIRSMLSKAQKMGFQFTGSI